MNIHMFYMLNMRIINSATVCYILLQSKSRRTPESTPESRADGSVIFQLAQALFPLHSVGRDLIDQVAAPQVGPQRRARSAEALLAGFLEEQQGFHNSSEAANGRVPAPNLPAGMLPGRDVEL
jgi:hypothetical protein